MCVGRDWARCQMVVVWQCPELMFAYLHATSPMSLSHPCYLADTRTLVEKLLIFFKNYIFNFFQLTIWMARPLTNNRIVWHTKISIKWLHWSVLICLILWVHLWGRLWWLLRRWSQLIIWSTTDRSLAHWMENIISRVWWNISILNIQINLLSIISRLRDNHLTS